MNKFTSIISDGAINCMNIIGFGSTIHVEAGMLSAALRLDRVLIRYKSDSFGHRIRVGVSFKKTILHD